MFRNDHEPTEMPNPEVVRVAQRRRFSAGEKLCILEEAEACTQPGEIGALLRREPVYSSYLSRWRQARDRGQAGQERSATLLSSTVIASPPARLPDPACLFAHLGLERSLTLLCTSLHMLNSSEALSYPYWHMRNPTRTRDFGSGGSSHSATCIVERQGTLVQYWGRLWAPICMPWSLERSSLT